MRLPRVRFTVRRMMVAVAVIGTLLGALVERRRRLERTFNTHRDWIVTISRMPCFGPGKAPSYETLKWNEHMFKKYYHAMDRPWLPLPPDPPKPR